MNKLESPSPATTPGSEADKLIYDLREAAMRYGAVRVLGNLNFDEFVAVLHDAEAALRAALSRETTDTQRLDAARYQALLRDSSPGFDLTEFADNLIAKQAAAVSPDGRAS